MFSSSKVKFKASLEIFLFFYDSEPEAANRQKPSGKLEERDTTFSGNKEEGNASNSFNSVFKIGKKSILQFFDNLFS